MTLLLVMSIIRTVSHNIIKYCRHARQLRNATQCIPSGPLQFGAYIMPLIVSSITSLCPMIVSENTLALHVAVFGVTASNITVA